MINGIIIEDKRVSIQAIETRIDYTKTFLKKYCVGSEVTLGTDEVANLILQMTINQMVIMNSVQTLLAEGLTDEAV